MTNILDKPSLRKEYGEIRRNISDRLTKEAEVIKKLKGYVWDKPNVFCYVSMGSELSTHNFIREEIKNRVILVPYTMNGIMTPYKLLDATRLETDKLGNVDKKLLIEFEYSPSVVVVPMLAFDENNYRLGYGGGYYDRYLKNSASKKIGLAFDEQMATLVVESFDVPLDVIITPSSIKERK